MKKLFIVSLALAALSMIPLTYLVAARGGDSRAEGSRSSGSRRTSGASVRTAGVSRTTSVASTGSRNIARTGSTRISTSSPSRLSTRTGTKVARAGRGGRHDRHGAFWGHRRDFRHFRGDFWNFGIGYPWWWYTYPRICVDEFGFEYPTSFCYQQPGLYFWWYR